VTEGEWLAGDDVDEMLDYLKSEAKVVRSPKGRRKMRLFACGCCRQVWQLIEDTRSRRLVELSEQFADGLAAPLELAEAEGPAGSAKVDADLASAGLPAMNHVRRAAAAISAALHTADKEAYKAARLASGCALCSVGGMWCIAVPNPAWDAHEKRQAALLHDLCGNPFQPLSDSAGWQTPAAVSLARAAYDQRDLPTGTLDSSRLAVLADALEEAGCTDPDLLSHLRQPGPHYRGCWAVDLILQKA
jgi:hypothetical protein